MADVRRAVRTWAREQIVPEGSLYLVALSGGGDSAALAWAAGLELPSCGLRVGGVIVDHQLQADSDQVARQAAEKAGSWGLNPVLIKTVTVGTTGGPEEAARTARYQALSEAWRETGAQGVLLAHTQDDQAETVLLGLARGSGPSGLKGMAYQEGIYSRPLLAVPRSSIRAALEDAGISWWEDPHNSDDRFTRVRVRNRVLPVVEQEIGPGVAEALARTAELFRQDSEALDQLALEVWARSGVQKVQDECEIAAQVLDAEPLAIASRVVRQMVRTIGAPGPTFVQMRQVLNLLTAWSGQSAIALSSATVEREGGVLRVKRTS